MSASRFGSFRKAIVRPPGPGFEKGITSSPLGPPDLAKAQAQHEAYCRALEHCGLEVIRLAADARFPDSTFVEDVAVLTPRTAVLSRPGAPSREGEVAGVRDELARHFKSVRSIEPPGTLDGGDICEAGEQVFIGISHRTNEEGARQLAAILREEGFSPVPVDVRASKRLLHLKSGIACLDDGILALVGELAARPEFGGFQVVLVDPAEEYAANCVRVNDRILLADGFPRFLAAIRERHYEPIALDVSEFRKMDGGLSCISLRF